MKKLLSILVIMFSMFSLTAQKQNKTTVGKGYEEISEITKQNIKDLKEGLQSTIKEVAETKTYTSFEDAIGPFVNKCIKAAEESGKFLLTEIPEVIAQYLIYEGLKYGLPILLAILIFIFGGKLIRYIYGKDITWAGAENKLSEKVFGYWTLKLLSLIVPMYLLYNNLLTFLQIVITPKFYLVKKFYYLIN